MGGLTRGTGRRRVAAWVVACLAAAGAGAAAGRHVLVPEPLPPDLVAAELTYTAHEGSVGRTVSYAAHATRTTVPLGALGVSGVVTRHGVGPATPTETGTVLLHVDERPVVLVEGAVPSYRDLSAGAVGEDVRQLQAHLHAAGHLRPAPNGTFGSDTARAVVAWQRSLGVPADGVVRAGDVVFAPDLPGRVVLDEGVAVGSHVEPGAVLGVVQVGAPSFTIVTETGQRRPPDAGRDVTVVLDGSRWPATTGVPTVDGEGRTITPVDTADGSPVCGEACDDVPWTTGPAVLTAEVVVVPEASGVVVPVAALRTDPVGRVTVTLVPERTAEVEVVAHDGGRAVVRGLAPGAVLRVFGDGGA